MDSNFLLKVFVFLVAACVTVPLAGKLRLSSVLGYLVAGVVIGPFGSGLIESSKEIMHFAEFGVVMMLFMIGLELEPAILWRLRKLIPGLGGLQVALTSLAFTVLGILLGYGWRISLACGLTLSLSSTALVLQLLQEKGLLKTAAGESAFAVLLFQDIAVIPLLIIMPLLAPSVVSTTTQPHDFVSTLPGWAHALAIAGTIALIVFGGHYASRHVFRYVAKTNSREIFTAISLALIVGTTLLMNAIGISPALGAFLAGVVLAKSEYRHTLQIGIQPFKGLLLGLFFISVGMGIDFGLMTQQPAALLTAVVSLLTLKIAILLVLGQFFGLESTQKVSFALALAQGGEFAFVLLQYGVGLQVLQPDQAAFLILAVTLSMATTPLLMIVNEFLIIPKFMSKSPKHTYDTITDHGHSVIIAGYGRCGQIIGKFMRTQGVPLTVLEKDPDQIELLRRFGSLAYFGDASRLDLLKSAGADQAKLLIVAVGNAAQALKIVRLAREAFPNLTIFARARDRRHAYELQKAGVNLYRCELFDASLWIAQQAMQFLGQDAADIQKKAHLFTQHAEEALNTSFDFFEHEATLIAFSKQTNAELARIMQKDIKK